MASGIYYGLYYPATDMLAHLLTDVNYGHEFNGNTDEPYSIVDDLPTTLMDLHNSPYTDMPFDPLNWDADGNWIG